MTNGATHDGRVEFGEWCEIESTEVAHGRDLSVMSSKNDCLAAACKRLAAVVLGHYASPERVAAVLQKLGKEKAAAYLRDKLPKAKRIRSEAVKNSQWGAKSVVAPGRQAARRKASNDGVSSFGGLPTVPKDRECAIQSV